MLIKLPETCIYATHKHGNPQTDLGSHEDEKEDAQEPISIGTAAATIDGGKPGKVGDGWDEQKVHDGGKDDKEDSLSRPRDGQIGNDRDEICQVEQDPCQPHIVAAGDEGLEQGIANVAFDFSIDLKGIAAAICSWR